MYADLPERHASILHTYMQGEHCESGMHEQILKFQGSNDSADSTVAAVGASAGSGYCTISIMELDRLRAVEASIGKTPKTPVVSSSGTQTDGVDTCTVGSQTVSRWVTLDSLGEAALSMSSSNSSTGPASPLSLNNPLFSETMQPPSTVVENSSLRHVQSMPLVKNGNENGMGISRRPMSKTANSKPLTKKSMASPYNDDADWIKLEKEAKKIEAAYQKSIPTEKKTIKKNKVLLSAIEVNGGRPSTTQQRPSTNQQRQGQKRGERLLSQQGHSRGGNSGAGNAVTGDDASNAGGGLPITPIKSSLGAGGAVYSNNSPVQNGSPGGLHEKELQEQVIEKKPSKLLLTQYESIHSPSMLASPSSIQLRDFLNQYDDLAVQMQKQEGKGILAPLLMEKHRSQAPSASVSPVPLGPRAPAALPNSKQQEEDNLRDYLNSYDDLAIQLQLRLDESDLEHIKGELRKKEQRYHGGAMLPPDAVSSTSDCLAPINSPGFVIMKKKDLVLISSGGENGDINPLHFSPSSAQLRDFLNQYDDLAIQMQTQETKSTSAPILMKKYRSQQATATTASGSSSPVRIPNGTTSAEDENLREYLNSYDELGEQLEASLEESERDIIRDQLRKNEQRRDVNAKSPLSPTAQRTGTGTGMSSKANAKGFMRNVVVDKSSNNLPPLSSSAAVDPSASVVTESESAIWQRPRSPSMTSVDSLLSIDSQASMASLSSLACTDTGTGVSNRNGRSSRVTTASGSGSPTRRRKNKAEPTSNKEDLTNPGLAVVNRQRSLASSSKKHRERPLSKIEKHLTESPLAEPYFSRIKKSETPSYVYFYDPNDGDVARQRVVEPTFGNTANSSTNRAGTSSKQNRK